VRCNGTELLTRLFQQIFHTEKMPDRWRESVILPIYKQKGDCSPATATEE
jgi:hypothetical protein